MLGARLPMRKIRDVLRLSAAGLSKRKIAASLGISTAAMLFWALLASGQIVMRKIDGWNTLSTVSSDQQKLDAAA